MRNDWRKFWYGTTARWYLEHEKQIRHLLDTPYQRVLRQLDEQRRRFIEATSPMARTLESMNSSLSSIAESFKPAKEIQGQLSAVNKAWENELASFREAFQGTNEMQLLLRSHTARITEISMAAQTMLDRIPWDSVGEAALASDITKASLQSKFSSFTDSYSQLYKSISQSANQIASFPPFVSDLPPIEFFHGTELLEVVTIPSSELEEPPPPVKNVRDEITIETETSLEALLAELDSELLVPLHGAREAIKSDNIDKTRHVSISLRELFTHVLHRLAPDNKVKNWKPQKSKPDFYSRGKPTRRARILYICDTINYGPFTNLIENDIDFKIGFLDSLHSGTHKPKSVLSEKQLRVMLIVMEGILRTLLETGRA